jgi:hypothetical protein
MLPKVSQIARKGTPQSQHRQITGYARSRLARLDCMKDGQLNEESRMFISPVVMIVVGHAEIDKEEFPAIRPSIILWRFSL